MCKLAYTIELNPESLIARKSGRNRIIGVIIASNEEAGKAEISSLYVNKKVFTSIHFTTLG